MKKLQTKIKRRILKWLLSGDHFSDAGLNIMHNTITGGSVYDNHIHVGFMVLNTWDLPEGYTITINRTPLKSETNA